jgi:hypothetical protein
MKNLAGTSLLGLNNLTTLLLTLGMLLAVGLACSGAKDARQAPTEYVGHWRSTDGANITIRPDGSADYRSGGTKVTGGKAQVSDSAKTLTITMLGMGPTFKVDKAPADDRMTLDGVVYKRVTAEE